MNIKTLPEAAELLGIKENTLRVAALNGRIPATKSKTTWLVDLDDPAVSAYQASFTAKERKAEAKPLPVCEICGKPVPRQRAKYCSRECYAKTYHSTAK
jgi:excisionase family DNA binding protein